MSFEIIRQYTSEQLEAIPDEQRKSMWEAGALTRDADNQHHALSSLGTKICIRETADSKGKMFLRRAVKFPSDGPAYHADVLVAELNGVRVYIDEHNNAVIVTTEDLSL